MWRSIECAIFNDLDLHTYTSTHRCNFEWPWTTLSDLQNFQFISKGASAAYAHKVSVLYVKSTNNSTLTSEEACVSWGVFDNQAACKRLTTTNTNTSVLQCVFYCEQFNSVSMWIVCHKLYYKILLLTIVRTFVIFQTSLQPRHSADNCVASCLYTVWVSL